MNKEIDEAAWLRERRLGIGGSDIGAIVGVNPWKTALDVFLDKTGQAQTVEPNESMKLGTALEPFVVKNYEERTGLKCVEQIGMFHKGVMCVNIDRIVDMGDGLTQKDGVIVSERILEAKTSRHEWVDGVPNSYQCQVQWYMGAFESVTQTDVAVYYTNGQKEPFHIFPVMKDKEVFEFLHGKAEEFWNKYVLTNTMPPPQNEDDARIIWAKESPKKVSVADQRIIDTIRKIRAIREQIDVLEDEDSKLVTEIMKAMGDSEILKTSDGPTGIVLATWKATKDTVKTDWKAIVGELNVASDIIARHTEVKANSRRFTIK